MVQRSAPEWRLTLNGRRLVESRPDGTETVTELDDTSLTSTLRERFGIPLDDDEVARLVAQAERASPSSGLSSRTSS
jgi:arylamine N-acetyltransferase